MLRAKQEKLAEAVQKQTMGNLVGKYLNNISSPAPESIDIPGEPSEAHFAFLFTFGDTSYHEAKKLALASI